MNYTRTNSLFQSGQFFKKFRLSSSMVFGLIITIALLFFELFNYSTTDYALRDLLGSLKFAGFYWATILAIAFCAIDFAGIARLFTPEQGSAEPKEVWYLFGAWILAATMNAMLTWWGVSMAIVNHQLESTTILATSTIRTIIPIFVAVMVWLIRILIIGTVSAAGDKFFWNNRPVSNVRTSSRQTTNAYNHPEPRPASAQLNRTSATPRTSYARPHAETVGSNIAEPTYHSVSMGAASSTYAKPGENSYNNARRQ